MRFQNAPLALWIYLSQITLCIPAEMRCFKVNSCKCIMRDGTGVINLEAIGDTEDFLGRLRPVTSWNKPPNTEVLLAFSPCLPLTEPKELAGTACQNAAACLVLRSHRLHGYTSHYSNHGNHDGSVFHYNQSSKTLSVSYFASAQDDRPLLVVHYHCSVNQSVSLSHSWTFGSVEPLQLWVGSPCACSNACAVGDLGLGTIFLIILSVSAAAYFLLGSCALRAFRTASGVQIAPEESVWCMICYLFTERQARRGPEGPCPARLRTP